MNCGECHTKKGLCCDKHPVCRRILLHKLRKTFASMHHEEGVSARKVQGWLRHSDIETTLKYLAASDDLSSRTREQVNRTFEGL
jgi:integrase